MKFSEKTYWDRRKKGFRGQVALPGSKEADYERKKLDKRAHKLWLEKKREEEAKKEVKDV